MLFSFFKKKTFPCRVPFSFHFYDDQPTSQVPTRLSSFRAFIRITFISAPLHLYRSLHPRAICRICILPPSCNCSFITALMFWENTSHPVGLFNICRTASVRRLCESWHSPTVSSSPGVSIWSLLRWLSRLKWGVFVWWQLHRSGICSTNRRSLCAAEPDKKPLLASFPSLSLHFTFLFRSYFSLRSRSPRHSPSPLSSFPSLTLLLIIRVTVFRLIDSTSWAWHK